MSTSWDDRVASFWASADDTDPAATLAGMADLVGEQPDGDPRALFEWASVQDFLGREAEAVPLYRAALDAGLDGGRRAQAIVQLASSLRNVGQAAEAVDLLRDASDHGDVGAARHAFLALALHDTGDSTEALKVALEALAPTLPMYGRAITHYAERLGGTDR